MTAGTSQRGPLTLHALGQGAASAHATSSSCAATKTPRRRKAAGACTIASARAALVLNGNQNRRKDRDAAHGGADLPSRAARCSATAARNTSHRSSPRSGGFLSEQNQPRPGRLPAELLQELRDQPPPARIIPARQQPPDLGKRHRTVRLPRIAHSSDRNASQADRLHSARAPGTTPTRPGRAALTDRLPRRASAGRWR